MKTFNGSNIGQIHQLYLLIILRLYRFWPEINTFNSILFVYFNFYNIKRARQGKITRKIIKQIMSKGQKEIEKQLQMKMIQQQLKHSLQLRRKIISKQLNKIQSMPLSQLLQKQRRPKQAAPIDHTKKYFESEINKSLSETGFESSLYNPAQRHAEIFKDTESKIREYRRELKKNPIMAQVKRGKLGMDTVFIVFGIMGFIFLPYYFGSKIKKNQAKIVESRGVDPKVIENLDEDSPINIDSVSQQSIHYLNREREMEIKQKLKRQNKISQLKRQLDL